MRIGAGAQPPLVLRLPTTTPVPTAPERAALLRLLALASGSPWSMPEPPPGDQVLDATPLPPPAAALLASTLPPVPGGNVGTSLSGDSPLPTGRVPLPGPSSAPGLGTQAPTAGPVGDRLSLSPVLAALGLVPGAPVNTPIANFALDVLAALTGEPRGQLQLLEFGPQTLADPEAFAALASKGPNELLRLLVRGTVHTADAQQIDMTLGLSLQRQAGGSLVDAALLDSIQSALEQLAQVDTALAYPGAAAGLANHSSSFQAMLDPRGLWPMQGFLLSGLLILGRAIEEDEAVTEADHQEADESDSDAPAHGDQLEERPARRPRKKPRRQSLDEPTPLPADGGVPIISANRWLELELRHWRTQLRLWMALPPENFLAAP